MKRHLFSNLITHPKFISDTKSAISNSQENLNRVVLTQFSLSVWGSLIYMKFGSMFKQLMPITIQTLNFSRRQRIVTTETLVRLRLQLSSLVTVYSLQMLVILGLLLAEAEMVISQVDPRLFTRLSHESFP